MTKSNWYKSARYFPIDMENDLGDFQDRTGVDAFKAHNEAQEVFDSTGIRPDREKSITQVVMPDKKNKVIGALATGWSRVSGDSEGLDKDIWEYSFDLSVLKNYQKKGIGRQLIKDAIDNYESMKGTYEEMGDYTRMKIWAVNANVARILEQEYGFDCQVVAYENGEPVNWMCYKS